MKKIFLMMLTILTAAACKPEGQEEKQSISLNHTTLDIGNEAVSQSVNVSSATPWTAKITPSDASSWITLSINKGRIGATVGIRIAANLTSATREATVVFSTEDGSSAELAVKQAGLSASSAIIRVGSYNLRVASGDVNDPDNNWTLRKPRLFTSINDCNFDVFGVQEVTTVQQTDLKSGFSSAYTIKFFSPYSQTGDGNKAQGILFKTDMFDLLDWHFFWLSDTPDIMTLNDINDDASYSRGGCCARLRHKASGIELYCFCAHGPLSADDNTKNAHVVIDMDKKYNPSGLPSFFVGDLNTRPASASSATYRTHWKDAFMELDAAQRSGIEFTFNGYSYPEGRSGSRIDFIYFRGDGVTPRSYCCSNKLYDGKFASDHFPVWADFLISR